jgi:acetyl/propionyl-CoA carboxylase alpha subunit/acetyl-CoA carboxylase carboxyltransferase component
LFRRILIANRGEVAVRIARAAHDLGIEIVAIEAKDDGGSLHSRLADICLPLGAAGPAAYLDGERLIALATEAGCDAVHPGYGFLAERANFARACGVAGLVFIGPEPEQLEMFGNKAKSRDLARRCGVPLLPATPPLDELVAAQEFMASLEPGAAVMVKAVAGGGGRGLRVVKDAADLPAAFDRCRSEALAAFGVGSVFVEQWLPQARHIEIQVVGDGSRVVALGERECSLQRRHQKLVEIAPSPSLEPGLRDELAAAATRMAAAVGYRSLGTFEFLVNAGGGPIRFAFLEVNPRLQVEHTVTEMVTGVDLVQVQIGLADGRSLAELGLAETVVPRPLGHAIELRINAEVPDEQGGVRPSCGRLEIFRPSGGPGVRVDSHCHVGYALPPNYDSLLAKLIVHTPSGKYEHAVRRAQRALREFEIGGIETNRAFLAELLARPEFIANAVDTGFVERHLVGLVAGMHARRPILAGRAADAPGTICAPIAGSLVQIDVRPGDAVCRGQQVAVLEAMKMEHVVEAGESGIVTAVVANAREVVNAGQPLIYVDVAEGDAEVDEHGGAPDLDRLRPDLQRVLTRAAFTLDAARPEAVSHRHAAGGRTARENLADLCDPGSFIEYGAFAIAAQTQRRTPDDLVRNTPADGIVSGIGTVNGADFGPERARCAVLAYDFTVLAGTQGYRSHRKKDRLLSVVRELDLPIVLFAEGGGGRPGEVDAPWVAGLNVPTFRKFAALSGRVPVVGIVHGFCFAGNAALLGCADVIIATEAANIGMGGPAMIEGGGLGVFRPQEIGPAADLFRNGVIDVLASDERAAVAVARQYLSYFQGRVSRWSATDVRTLRHLVPENRVRAYDMRAIIGALADEGSVLELRRGFGLAMITALARIEGRPVGIYANNPHHLGGAIDPDAADKAARFMQLCDAHGLPIISLCDTPGFMVGPDVERRAHVRHACRLFVSSAHLRVPCFTVVVRKGYGLGAQAMAAGEFEAPVFTVAWPTGEFGPMGLEGAVKLGFRKELEAAAPGAERQALYERLVAQQYATGSAINMATGVEIDAVIDPADTRSWLVRGMDGAASHSRRTTGRFIDPW